MTQGALHGIGSGLLFAPSISLLEEWFAKRRSFAYGIMSVSPHCLPRSCHADIASFAVSTCAGVVLPPIYLILLEEFGSRSIMLGWGVTSGVLLTLSVLCCQPRVLYEEASSLLKISY